jgi:hypothetical protein
MYRSLFNDALLTEVLLTFERCGGMFLIRKFKGLGKEQPWLISRHNVGIVF